MECIHIDKNGIGLFFIKSDCDFGGECLIVDCNNNYIELDEAFGHTKAVAIERGREKRRLLKNNSK
jgi:hypothetical protein